MDNKAFLATFSSKKIEKQADVGGWIDRAKEEAQKLKDFLSEKAQGAKESLRNIRRRMSEIEERMKKEEELKGYRESGESSPINPPDEGIDAPIPPPVDSDLQGMGMDDDTVIPLPPEDATTQQPVSGPVSSTQGPTQGTTPTQPTGTTPSATASKPSTTQRVLNTASDALSEIMNRVSAASEKFMNWANQGMSPFVISGLVGAGLFSAMEFLKRGDEKHYARAIIIGALTGVSVIGLMKLAKYIMDNYNKSAPPQA